MSLKPLIAAIRHSRRGIPACLCGVALTLALPATAQEFRTLDGSNNNAVDVTLGQSGTNLIRNFTSRYGDGFDSPGGAARPEAREVSNAVSAQTGVIDNDRRLSSWIWQWGQILDHDLDLTLPSDPADPFDILVPLGDDPFDLGNTGTNFIPLNRFRPNPAGTDSDNQRQHPNELTHYIDASVVYGSTDARAAVLRDGGGRLLTSTADNGEVILPRNVTGFDNDRGPPGLIAPGQDFIGGDPRANEQLGLTAAHVLLVREHNRIADAIAAHSPGLDEDAIYLRARAIVGAEIAAITYNEWLPALFGQGNYNKLIGRYRGYNPGVDPRVSSLFSTAAFRIGHTLLIDVLPRLDADGNTIGNGDLPLRFAFFNPEEIQENGADSLLRGLARVPAQEIDTRVVSAVRNFLFGPPGPGVGGFDLVSINIQRGREMGMPDYNQARADFGLTPVATFADITSDPALAAALENVYGDVNEVDLFIGMLAEDHLPGGSLGELLATLLADQFRRVRDGDRLFYLNDPFFTNPSPADAALQKAIGATLKDLDKTRMSDLLRRNVAGGKKFFQEKAFFVHGK